MEKNGAGGRKGGGRPKKKPVSWSDLWPDTERDPVGISGFPDRSGQIPHPAGKKIKIKINLTLKNSSPPQMTSQSPSRPSPESSKILDSISDLLTAAPRQFSHARPESREANVSDSWVPSDFRPNVIKHMARIRPY
jgi:hypothetical protein